MAIKDIFKISRKTFFNPSGWLDYDFLKQQTLMIFTTIKSLFDYDRPIKEETFEQAMQRLNLTEEDVKDTARTYRIYSLIFFMLSFIGFIYSFYLLFGPRSISGWLLGMGVTGLFLAQAFRYDFWAFQMRRRKLGMTFDEWKRHILGEKGE